MPAALATTSTRMLLLCFLLSLLAQHTLGSNRAPPDTRGAVTIPGHIVLGTYLLNTLYVEVVVEVVVVVVMLNGHKSADDCCHQLYG
jgi:hypothetical protein